MDYSYIPTLTDEPPRGPQADDNAAGRAIPCNQSHDTDAVHPSFGAPSQPGDLASFGPYRILKTLGQGGMGTVYLAEDTRLGRQVALKLCHRANKPSSLERFRREARAAAALRHPNICPVHECDIVEGVPYFTMARIEGPSLDAWLLQRGDIPGHEAACLVRKLALAMQYAHENGVVHRDLKPSNVILERSEPIILDFGLARYGEMRLTVEGSVMGTPSYMAPEQVKGDMAAIGPACDIYNLGALLYELLAGRPPFDGPPMVVLHQVLNEPPQGPRQIRPEIDAALEAICLKCLAKKTSDRWPDMTSFAAALSEWLKSVPPVVSGNEAVGENQPQARDTVDSGPSRRTSITLDERAAPRTNPGRFTTDPGYADTEMRAGSLAMVAGVVVGSGVLAVVLTCAWFGAVPSALRTPKSPQGNQAVSAQNLLAAVPAVEIPGRSTQDAEPAPSGNAAVNKHAASDDSGAKEKPRPAAARVLQKPAEQAPQLRIVQSSPVVFIKPGQKLTYDVHVARPGDEVVRLKFVDLPPGLTATELVLPRGQDDGAITIYAALDKAEQGEVTKKVTLRATAEAMVDTRAVQLTLDGRETLTPSGTMRGYLHELDLNGPTIAVVDPPRAPLQYRIASGVEVRTLSSGDSGSLAGLRLDHYVVVRLGKSADGSLVAMSIMEQAPPLGYPPPPRETRNGRSPARDPESDRPPPPPPPPFGPGRPLPNRRTPSG